jgi:pimeloyl-ACP methyl ester carboxylesterase
MKFLKWGGRYLYHLPGIQTLTSYFSSPHSGKPIEQFFLESPVPTEAHPYEALEIFWGYNFFKRLSSTTNFNYQVPILVISGGQDPTFTESMAETLAHTFPNSQHFHLPEASHVLMAEFPDVINQKIAAWLIQQLD